MTAKSAESNTPPDSNAPKSNEQWLGETIDSKPLTRLKCEILGQLAQKKTTRPPMEVINKFTLGTLEQMGGHWL